MAIQFLRGTKSKVAASTRVLAEGQPLYETDTNKLKVGDGSTQAKSLPYVKVDTDSALSSTSTNPVQNKVINTKFTSVQSDIDSKVPNTRTVNGKALSTNIILSAYDVGAATMAEVNSAIQTAIGNAIGGSY